MYPYAAMTYLLGTTDAGGIARVSWQWYSTANGAGMHGSILILAKKKAAGPGGYFDPMMSEEPLAMGPAVFEMAEGQEDENTDPKGYDVATMDKAKGSPSMDLKSVIAQLKATAAKLDQLAMSGKLEGEDEKMEAESEDEGEDEGEDTEELPAEEPKSAPKAKKGPPAFLKKTVMKF
jgi:hypothetical protein